MERRCTYTEQIIRSLIGICCEKWYLENPNSINVEAEERLRGSPFFVYKNKHDIQKVTAPELAEKFEVSPKKTATYNFTSHSYF